MQLLLLMITLQHTGSTTMQKVCVHNVHYGSYFESIIFARFYWSFVLRLLHLIEFFTIRIFWKNLADLPNENKSGEIQKLEKYNNLEKYNKIEKYNKLEKS